MAELITISWPETLPGLLVEGFRRQPRPQAVRSATSTGPESQRRRTSVRIDDIAGNLALTNEQLAAFEDFYYDTLRGGVLKFNWEDPVTGQSVIARFIASDVQDQSPRSHASHLVRVSLEFRRKRTALKMVDGGLLNNRLTVDRDSVGTIWNADIDIEEIAADLARRTYDPFSEDVVGALVEEARDHLFVEDSGDPNTWVLSTVATLGGTRTQEGLTWGEIVPDAGAGGTSTDQGGLRVRATEVGTTGNYALSFLAEANGITTLRVRRDSASVDPLYLAVFDLAAGTVDLDGSVVNSAQIEEIEPGIYRCSAQFSANVENTNVGYWVQPDDAGESDGTASFWFAAPAVEQGDFPTSYYAVNGGGTRDDDDIQGETSLEFEPRFGTWYLTATTAPGPGTQVLYQIDGGSEDDRVRVERNASREIRCIVTRGGSEQVNLNMGVVNDGVQFKLAFTWQKNNFNAVLNGGPSVSSASGLVPAAGSLTTRRLGRDSAGNYWNGPILEAEEEYKSVKLDDLQAYAA